MPDRLSEIADVGRTLREQALGAKADRLQQTLAAMEPQLAEWADNFVFGQVWSRPNLTFEERQLVAITALAATEHVDQLRGYLHGALQAGMPAEKIQEVLVMMVVYLGFPAALTALWEWKQVQAAAAKPTGSGAGRAPS